MPKGKLIIIEAGDGSGKATQTRALYERLLAEGRRVVRVEFPDYEADGSMLVRMYLRGDFGTDPESVNAYAASTFFAADRFASYRMKWQKDYEAGAIILADRYTTSNLVHQAVKLSGEEREAFFQWVLDYEYKKLGLPEPDLVLYLDMELTVAQRLLAARAAESGRSDIHERDQEYLAHCYRAYHEVAARFGWAHIPCSRLGTPRPIADIHEDIYERVRELLGKISQ